jgi:hypothetical protein
MCMEQTGQEPMSFLFDESLGSTIESGLRHIPAIEKSSWILDALEYVSCDCDCRLPVLAPRICLLPLHAHPEHSIIREIKKVML